MYVLTTVDVFYSQQMYPSVELTSHAHIAAASCTTPVPHSAITTAWCSELLRQFLTTAAQVPNQCGVTSCTRHPVDPTGAGTCRCCTHSTKAAARFWLQLRTVRAAVWHAALHAPAAAGRAWLHSQPAVPAWPHFASGWHALPVACGSACWHAARLACPSEPAHCANLPPGRPGQHNEDAPDLLSKLKSQICLLLHVPWCLLSTRGCHMHKQQLLTIAAWLDAALLQLHLHTDIMLSETARHSCKQADVAHFGSSSEF